MVMGKRTAIVVSSSDDDEDKDFSLRSNFSYSKSKKKPASVPRTNPRRAKKARISSSCSRSPKETNPFDEMRLFCEEFGEGFTGLKVPAGSRKNNKELWADKYAPRSFEELAVHKKKVEEVKVWFEERLRTVKDEFRNNVLLITGQAGVGKSATIHVLASYLGAVVCEWNTPTPTIFQEHIHTSNPELRYTSKLDEFENFVERIRKYGLISSSSAGGSTKSIILLIDDLPLISGKLAFDRLHRCLHHLVQSACIPTVILITDYGSADSADYSTRRWEELQSSLQSAGTCKVAFNPITVNSITKTLSRICREEQCKISANQIDLIAKASGGDIRHAITSLQYFCVKPNSMRSLSTTTVGTTYSRKKSCEVNHTDHAFALSFGRDETLSLFHALGKFLHNKRDGENPVAFDKDAMLLRERFTRLPLKMDDPEKVLCQAHGQARNVTDFLQENVYDFLHEDAIGDAWVVASYLSDADNLLAFLSGSMFKNYEVDNIIRSTAASVAARGVLFGNNHPSSPRWHAIRRPMLWQVEQSLWNNKSEMVNQRTVAYNGLNLYDLSVIATEWKPVQKWLGGRTTEYSEAVQASIESDMVDHDTLNGMSLDTSWKLNADDEDDDEIEDW